MRTDRTLLRGGQSQDLLKSGLCIGFAGGLAEIGVVWVYCALTGGDVASVARHIASATGLDSASATIGACVHMGLAGGLGICLRAVMYTAPGRLVSSGMIFPFMLGSLAIIWAINFFVVLPVVSPDFAHLLPYGVTLASKLAFGLTAAATSLANVWPIRLRFTHEPTHRDVLDVV